MPTKKIMLSLNQEDQVSLAALQSLLFARSAPEAIRVALRQLVEQLDVNGDVRESAAHAIEQDG